MSYRFFSLATVIIAILFLSSASSFAQSDAMGMFKDAIDLKGFVKSVEAIQKGAGIEGDKKLALKKGERKKIVTDTSPAEKEAVKQSLPLSRLEKIYRRYYQDIGEIRTEDPVTGFLKKEEQKRLSQKEQMLRAGEKWRGGRYDENEYRATLQRMEFNQKLLDKVAPQSPTIETSDDSPSELSYVETLLDNKIQRELEKEFGKKDAEGQFVVEEAATDDTEALRQFGYDLFWMDKNIETDDFGGTAGVVEVENLAVPGNDYIIGPGDYLLIRAWGAGVDFEEGCSVSNEGTISISKMGVISVAGMKSGEVGKAVNAEAQKYIPGVNLRVTLDSLKTLEVYFSGNINQPGLHVMPPFSTIVTALIKAGGPTKDGSLRNIKLIRNNRVLSLLDVYDILLQGDRSDDMYLQSGDLIFVPDIGETVAMAGLVRKLGIFELKNEKTWQETLGLAGGLLPQADSGRVTLKRFIDNQGYKLKEIHFNASVLAGKGYPVLDGDFLMARPVVPLQKAVKISGHVFDPRLVEYKPGLTLRDVIQTPETLKPGAIMSDALVRRYNPLTGYYTTLRFSPRSVLDGNRNMRLAEYDEIIILSKEDYDIEELVHIGGAVWKPGTYPFSPEMSLGSLVAMAGGLKKSAMLANVEVNRQETRENRVVINRQNVDWQALREKGRDIVLQDNDYVLIQEIKNYGRVATITVEGEVVFPGIYSVKEGDRLSNLLQRAGGYTKSAYLYGASFTRETARVLKQRNYARLISDLEIEMGRVATIVVKQEGASAGEVLAAQSKFIQGLKGREEDIEGRVVINLASLPTLAQSKYDFEMEDGDVVTIPRKPDFVSVLGSVYSSNTYFYDSDFTVAEYLRKAGGITHGADKKRMYVIRANGDVVSRKSSGGSYLLSSFDQMKLMPGDSLVVPEDLERVPWFKMVRDVSDLLFKMATTYGVVISIAND
ncbi:SLBB domain-containing protein [Candidatus Pacearchaeota archaeon]|nr:SLBB domain-containing protein [Candidatus Pacearchaeota archaeon]